MENDAYLEAVESIKQLFNDAPLDKRLMEELRKKEANGQNKKEVEVR